MTGAGVCAMAAIGGTPGDAAASFAADIASYDPGPFSGLLALNPSQDVSTPALQAADVVERAAGEGADWILLVAAGERIHPQAFTMVAPATAAYDAVWGGIGIGGPEEIDIPKACRFTCDRMPDAAHMTLEWWVGRSHFARTDVARAVGFSDDAGEAWYADYLMRFWRRGGCLKTAQPLTTAENLPAVGDDEKAFIREDLDRHPQFMAFDYGGRLMKVPYTGMNPTVERVQLRGVFFEQRELEAVARTVDAGGVIVDVGANTGNHSLFFAAAMDAARVIVFEPNPAAGLHLRRTIEANGLTNVDTSHLGAGVGRENGRMTIDAGRRGHLGTARLIADDAGGVEVRTLDDAVQGPVDLIKIDVESMELDVLDGARRLIEMQKPVLLVEVEDANIRPFLALVGNLGYRVERVFADEGYANYLVTPAQGVTR